MRCAVTGFNRDYARRALKAALTPRVVKPPAPRPPKYDAKVVAALEKCWAVVNAPAGKRLAPILGELVPVLPQHGELDIDEDPAALLIAMSAANTGITSAVCNSCCGIELVGLRRRSP